MGSRDLRAFGALAVLILLVAPVATAQDGTSGPEELWTYDPDGSASVNDLAMDADGQVLTAVQGDANAAPTANDDEVLAWDLGRSKTSRSPSMRDDPSSGLGAPEGLGVVAIEPNPDGKGNYIAVGREGSSDASTNNIYVYRRSSGGGSENQVSYDGSAPGGAVQDLWFIDRSKLLAYHEDAISLLTKRQGTQYREPADGRWTPDNGETIQDVEIARSASRVAVVTSEDPDGVGNVTLTLRVLEVNATNGLEQITDPWTRSRPDPGTELAFARGGGFTLLGTGQTLFFHGLVQKAAENVTEDGFEHRFSHLPWTRNGPADVTSVSLAPRGAWLAAGFANGRLGVYERISDDRNDPLAQRATETPIDTGSSPNRVVFADGNRSLIVQAAGLMAFDNRQFNASQTPSPLWTIPGVRGFAVSDDGQRFAIARPGDSGDTIGAREHRFEAELSLDAPPTVKPGRTANVTGQVANVGSAFDAYRFAVDELPSSWSTTLSETPIELLPGARDNVTIQLTPSPQQSPGDVPFIVRAVSQSGPGNPTVAQTDLSIRVEEVHAAAIDLEAGQQSIDQGGTVELSPTIRNTGNAGSSIVLNVRQDADWTVRIGDQQTNRRTFDLEPGESQTVTVELDAPDNVERGTRNGVELVVRPEAGGTRATASVPVVVDPSYGAQIQVPEDPVPAQPGQTVDTDVTVVNDGNTRDTLSLEVESNASNPELLWRTSLSSTSLTLDAGGEDTVTVSVDVPRGATTGGSSTVTLRATSQATGERVGEGSYTVEIPEETQDSPLGLVLAVAATGIAALAAGRNER